MQTTYLRNQTIGLEGQPIGDRETRPGFLPWLAQQTQIRIASSEAGDLVITIADDDTAQSWDLTVAISGAVEATSLDEMLAAWRANGQFNALASVTEDGAEDLEIVFRSHNRAYTVTTVPPGSMTAVVSEVQAPGGAGLEFGRMVARGSGDMEIQQVSATTEIADLFGFLFRTDANHFHSLENDTPTAVDATDRGRHYAHITKGRALVKVEEAVTPASEVWMRRALTSSAGRLGGFRVSAVGGQESHTVVPVINLIHYGFEFGWRGRHYTAAYHPTDATTSVEDAIDGLFAALGTVSGLTFSESATLLTIQTAAGEKLDYIRNSSAALDADTLTVAVAETVAADADAINISAIAEYESTAAAEGLAQIRFHM